MLTDIIPQADRKTLSEMPNLESIDLLLADNNGLLRGKRIERNALEKVYQQGVYLPYSLFGTSITGDTCEETGLGFKIGDRDAVCMPIPGTLHPIPWKEGRAAQLMLTMLKGDASPYEADPRVVLHEAVTRLQAHGLTAVIAVELEFFLFDKAFEASGVPGLPVNPLKNVREDDTQVYFMETLDAYETFIKDVHTCAKAQQIPAYTATAEYAPGQFEINLSHTNDAILACDHALLLKRVIKAVAAQHGYQATFMAKPRTDLTGSGTHIHLSLLDERGENVFASPEHQPNPTLRHALAGLQKTMPEAMLLFAPHANSWRRFCPESYTTPTPCWGYNNRTVALRIPASGDADRRIEHRVAGADANPYLVTAAVLSGVQYGLEKQLEPTAPITGNAYEQIEPNDALNWRDAIKTFEASSWLGEYFPPEFLKVFHAIKQAELALFEKQITPMEYRWYLNNV